VSGALRPGAVLSAGLLLVAPSAQRAPAAGGSPPPGVLTVVSVRGERRVAVLTERGFPAVAVASLANVLSLRLDSAPAGSAAISVAGRRFAFVLGAAYFRFGDAVHTLAAGPYLSRDSLFVPFQWAVEALPRLLPEHFSYDPRRARLEETAPSAAVVVASPSPRAGQRVVAIDPGHGGRDVGMVGPIGGRATLREKEVTLAVGRLVARELERRGVRAVLTRNADSLVALGDRGRIAARHGADLFVSIHVNAADPRWRNAAAARGFETYFLAEARTEDARRVAQMENASVRFETTAAAPRGDPLSFILNDLAQNEHLRESSRLATLIQQSLARVHPASNRGVKQAGFMVLATAFMPAVLVEVGFGSNDAESRYLTSAAGQQRLAAAIADGIERWLAEYERRVAQ
jgi:N-acetylmuramoyl-L-alanine amidase